MLNDEQRAVHGVFKETMSLTFTLFTQQFKIQMQCVQLYIATYNPTGRVKKARSALELPRLVKHLIFWWLAVKFSAFCC